MIRLWLPCKLNGSWFYAYKNDIIYKFLQRTKHAKEATLNAGAMRKIVVHVPAGVPDKLLRQLMAQVRKVENWGKTFELVLADPRFVTADDLMRYFAQGVDMTVGAITNSATTQLRNLYRVAALHKLEISCKACEQVLTGPSRVHYCQRKGAQSGRSEYNPGNWRVDVRSLVRARSESGLAQYPQNGRRYDGLSVAIAERMSGWLRQLKAPG